MILTPASPKDYITSWPYLPLESTLEPRRKKLLQRNQCQKKKKKDQICMKMCFLNVLWSPCFWPAFCSALIGLFSILWWTRKGDEGTYLKQRCWQKLSPFLIPLACGRRLPNWSHQTCRLSIHWGLGLWRATSWEVLWEQVTKWPLGILGYREKVQVLSVPI